MAKFRTVDLGATRWFTREDENGDKVLDHGKPVRVKVHALTKDEERNARRAAYGNRKTSKLNNETFLNSLDRGEAYTREAAISALEDTENHNVELSGPKAVARFAELLKVDASTLKEGGEVCLDGKWTPELKRAWFTEFAISKMEAKEIADLSLKVATKDADEEAEATGDFSQP